MDWRNALLIKYNLNSPAKKIVIDRTGMLISQDFQQFLDQSGIISIQSDNLSQIISHLNNDQTKLIISSLSNIPSYLQNRADIHEFSYYNLPFNIEQNLYDRLNSIEILNLCNYLSASNPHLAVTKNNIDEILHLSYRHFQNHKIKHLTEQIGLFLSQEPDYNKIIDIGIYWGKLLYTSYSIKQDIPKETELLMDKYVMNFVLSGNLKNIWYTGPGDVKAVDQVIRFLQHQKMEKFALVCFDGMGIAEWELLKEYLNPGSYLFKEKFIYALIPTTTAISRVALFSGSHEAPYISVKKDEIKAFRESFPTYEHHDFRGNFQLTADSLLGITALTILYNFFDELAHSTKFPPNFDSKYLYFDAVKNYLTNMKLSEIFDLLLDAGYRVFICSDHGSTVATGIGKNIDKWLHDKFARRGCIVDKTSLLELYEYPQYIIPYIKEKEKVVVLTEKRSMFDTTGKVAITHGGVTVDELIVPFVEIAKS